jgi:hypothetical protein
MGETWPLVASIAQIQPACPNDSATLAGFPSRVSLMSTKEGIATDEIVPGY